jgi:PAS domain S-box
MEKSGSYDLEIQITTAKGNKKCIRNIGQSHFKDGKCIRIFGTAQDITDRKKAEIQLKETNKSLIERIKEQRCLYEISSLDEQKLTIPELLQKAVSIIPSGFQYAEFAETSITWDKSIYKSKNFKELNKFLTRSEQPLPRENLIIVVNYPSGISGVPENPFLEEEKTLLVAITQEISQKIDQIVTQTKLHQAEEKYKNVVEHSTNMFYQHDLEGVLTYVSPQSTEFLGYEPEEAKKQWMEFITDNPINRIGEKHTQKAIETGEIQPTYELELRRKDGRLIWVEVNEAPFLKMGK